LHKNQLVSDMASDALTRQARARAERAGEAFAEAHRTVLETEAGRLLEELRDGPNRGEQAMQWQEDLAKKRSEERRLARREE
jgi:hypothetical protein